MFKSFLFISFLYVFLFLLFFILFFILAAASTIHVSLQSRDPLQVLTPVPRPAASTPNPNRLNINLSSWLRSWGRFFLVQPQDCTSDPRLLSQVSTAADSINCEILFKLIWIVHSSESPLRSTYVNHIHPSLPLLPFPLPFSSFLLKLSVPESVWFFLVDLSRDCV